MPKWHKLNKQANCKLTTITIYTLDTKEHAHKHTLIKHTHIQYISLSYFICLGLCLFLCATDRISCNSFCLFHFILFCFCFYNFLFVFGLAKPSRASCFSIQFKYFLIAFREIGATRRELHISWPCSGSGTR